MTALLNIGIDETGHYIRDLICIKRRANHFANSSPIALFTPQGNLIPLFTILINAQYANIANMMMAAGVNTTGDIETNIT